MKVSDESNPVLAFIDTFQNWNSNLFDSDVLYDVLDRQFTGGYCYHFAVILKSVFNRGTICYTWPFSHIVWKDDDNRMYDFNGEYSGEAEYFIPFDWIKQHYPSFANDFIHYGIESNEIKSPDQDRDMKRAIGKAWSKDQGIHYDTNIDEYFFGFHETDS